MPRDRSASGDALYPLWPEYCKPMSAVRIRDRAGLAEVQAGASVEPEIPLFCRCWVALSFDAFAVCLFAWSVGDCRAPLSLGRITRDSEVGYLAIRGEIAPLSLKRRTASQHS